MKNILTVLFLSCATALGGCAGAGGGAIGGGTTTVPDIAGIIAQVQSYCRIACGFVPTASTIASILSGGNPGVMAATSISQAICAAIAPPTMAGRYGVRRMVKGWVVTPGAVNGVPVR